MNAVATELPGDISATEKALYAWGDECRARSNELGLPASSGIARMIAQQLVFEQHARSRRGRRSRKPVTHVMQNGTRAKLCVCGRIYVEKDCPRCRHDPRPSEAQVHGTETKSFKPKSMTALASSTAQIDAIVAESPGWVQKTVKLSYLFLVRDSKAAERLRIRKDVYAEQRAAAVEYVAERLALRAC